MVVKTAKRQVGLVFFPAFDWCISPSHPERQERLVYTRDQIMEEGLLDIQGIEEYRPLIAEDSQIQRCHVCVPDVHQRVTQSHRIAAGGCLQAANLLLENKADCAFALLRPPGHHAMRIVHGTRGFCTINNEAIMVEHIRHQLGPEARIAIVDTDAHHADGTQDIYYNDPGVLHISLHQDGRTLYPGTGGIHERGGPAAYGQTINIPLPPLTGDEGMLYVMENLVIPILEEWAPNYIINGAGQDNHYSDPLTNMNFSASGYARLTELLRPDLVVLEGGYSIEGALPYINTGLIMALAGLDYSHLQEPDRKQADVSQPLAVTAEIHRITHEVSQMWTRRKKANLKRLFGSGPYYNRERIIYYDTDGIEEIQKEKIRLCPHCVGWRWIESQAVKGGSDGFKICAALVPWQACEKCRTSALAQYDQAVKSRQFDRAFYQDSQGDLFLSEII